MTDWFTEGYDAAESSVLTAPKRSKRRFWTKQNEGEVAVIRFLAPAKKSINYMRSFIPGAQGEKYYTSPQTQPDPFLQHNYTLQRAFAWKIIDRRVIEFKTDDGETKKIGPRLLYFAEGRQTQRALVNFEELIREQLNEERLAEGKTALTENEFNLTHFDIRAKKEKDSPWQFFARKPAELSAEDKQLIEKQDFDLKQEIAPLPLNQIETMLTQIRGQTPEKESETEYAYGEDDNSSEPVFFDE